MERFGLRNDQWERIKDVLVSTAVGPRARVGAARVVNGAPPGAGTDNRRGHGDAQMGFAGAGAADEDCIALGVQEGAGGEFMNLPFIDRLRRYDSLSSGPADGCVRPGSG